MSDTLADGWLKRDTEKAAARVAAWDAPASAGVGVKALTGEVLPSGRDIWELANQLEGYVGPSTPDDLAAFLIREGKAAAELASALEALRADNERLKAKVRELAALLDKAHGTPCEQVRHQLHVECLEKERDGYRMALIAEKERALSQEPRS